MQPQPVQGGTRTAHSQLLLEDGVAWQVVQLLLLWAVAVVLPVAVARLVARMIDD